MGAAGSQPAAQSPSVELCGERVPAAGWQLGTQQEAEVAGAPSYWREPKEFGLVGSPGALGEHV